MSRSNRSVDIEVFEFSGNGIQEGGPQCAIYYAVIVTERNVHHVPDRNAVALWCFDHHGSFLMAPTAMMAT